jgi:uncharacterized damage-inducible protein DinB
MNNEDVLFLVGYHIRANERILEMTAELSEDELRRPASLDHGTAFQTLRHLLDVDWSWREFLKGNDVGEMYLWDVSPLSDLQSIRAFWADEHARLLAFARSLDQRGLDEPMTIGNENLVSVPRWQLLAHIVNHGTQHRSELARYLTECGHSPGDLDLV